MHPYRSLRAAAALVLAAVLLSPAPAHAAVRPSLADSIARLLPDGEVPVEILTPQYSERMSEIARKIDSARRANPRFFQGWLAAHPGGPPPWNPAFGVTRAEYEDYLREGRTASFKIRQRARLTFTRNGRSHVWKLTGWGLLGPVNTMVIDADQGMVASPRSGVLPLIGVSAPNEPGVQLPWLWYAVWRAEHVVGDPRKGGQALQASLHIGPLGDGHTTGLYWVSRRFNGGTRLADEFLLLRFPSGR